jgi:hypothetical protein
MLLAGGCVRCGTGDSANVFFPKNNACKSVAEVAAQPEYMLLPHYAALAASVYNTDPETNQPLGKRAGSMREFCEDATSFYLPPGFELMQPGKQPPLGAPAHGWDSGKLNYNVVAQRVPGGNNRAFIIFRGTDDKGDWFANMRWFTRVIPLLSDEYEQLQRILPELASVVHQEYGDNATITAVGHSLGGGLAQMAAYGFPWGSQTSNIDTVYAFDPSPVTGFYSVAEGLRKRNSVGLRIYRIYEHGEVLAYIRLIMKSLYPVSDETPAITQARFNLLRGDVFEQHGMRSFACESWRIFGMKELP